MKEMRVKVFLFFSFLVWSMDFCVEWLRSSCGDKDKKLYKHTLSLQTCLQDSLNKYEISIESTNFKKCINLFKLIITGYNFQHNAMIG